jgi:hypothetical protein
MTTCSCPISPMVPKRASEDVAGSIAAADMGIESLG